jgi:hypothetical protein
MSLHTPSPFRRVRKSRCEACLPRLAFVTLIGEGDGIAAIFIIVNQQSAIPKTIGTNHQITNPDNYRDKSPNHQITKLPNHQIYLLPSTFKLPPY